MNCAFLPFASLRAGLLATAMLLPAASVHAQSAPDIMQATLVEPDQKTAEVSTEELRGILADGSATVFDARPPLEYAIGHIPGAVNVAQREDTSDLEYVSDVAEIGRVLGENMDAPVVLYCNGPFCGKSKRLAQELMDAGYTDVRRYQLGAPVWRALGGVMQIEPEGVRYVHEGDDTAVFFDARSAEAFGAGTMEGAQYLPLEEVSAAKDDGRLPMEDHNTRIIVFGENAEQARAVAEEIAKNAFSNTAFYGGSLTDLNIAQQ